MWSGYNCIQEKLLLTVYDVVVVLGLRELRLEFIFFWSIYTQTYNICISSSRRSSVLNLLKQTGINNNTSENPPL